MMLRGWCFYILISSFLFLECNTASSVSLTSSVEEQGRQAACPGEEVTFTCIVDDGAFLEWISVAFSDAPETFSLFITGDEVGVSRMHGQFTTNLTRLVLGSPGIGDITSTLQFNASAEHDGIVIQCTDSRTPLSVSLTVVTTVSAPLNPVVENFNYQRDNFTVAVEWTYPDSGPTPDIFTVLVSTGESTTSTQTVPGNETSVALTLLYNVDYTVGITATLCGETSAPATTSISEAGCEGPEAPSNGDILLFESSEEGAVIVYQCSPGYSPRGPRNSTCTANGWVPNPADVDCSSVMQTGTITLGSASFTPPPSVTLSNTMSSQTTVSMPTSPTPSTSNTDTSMKSSDGDGDGGVIAAIVVPLLFLIICVVLIVLIAVLVVWKRRSAKYQIPSQQLQDISQSGIEMENRYIEDDKPAPQSNGAQPPPVMPLAQYSEVQEATDQPPLAQYSDVELKPPEQHPKGLVYADLNIMKKSDISQPPEIQNPVQYSAILPAGHRVPSTNRPAPSQPAPHPADSSLNLDSLLIQLKEVEDDWKELGECFGVSPSQLEEIASHCLAATDSMIEVVDLWLREYPGRPTWKEVADVLRRMHHYRLAEDISNVYSTGTLPKQVDNRVPSLSNNAHSEPPPPRPPREDVNAPPSIPSKSSHHHKPPPRPPKAGVKPAVEKPPQRPPKTPPQQNRQVVQDPDAPPVPPKLYTEEEALPPRPPKPHPRK